MRFNFYFYHFTDCKVYKANRCRLRDHVRSHTQEKVIGCPNCGGIFSCNTKFSDHCERQAPVQRKYSLSSFIMRQKK